MKLTTHDVPVSDSDLLMVPMHGSLRGICQILSCTNDFQGIEVILAGNRAGEETMKTITTAKQHAQEQGLIMYVRSKAGDLRITFARQRTSRDTALPTNTRGREHS